VDRGSRYGTADEPRSIADEADERAPEGVPRRLGERDAVGQQRRALVPLAGDSLPRAGTIALDVPVLAASFVIVGLTEGETTRGAYIPPHMQDGHIVPGHVEPHA